MVGPVSGSALARPVRKGRFLGIIPSLPLAKTRGVGAMGGSPRPGVAFFATGDTLPLARSVANRVNAATGLEPYWFTPRPDGRGIDPNDASLAPPGDARELAHLLCTGAAASRRPAPRTGGSPLGSGRTTPTGAGARSRRGSNAGMSAAALIAKGEAAVRLGAHDLANDAFAAARAIALAEKERRSPSPSPGPNAGPEGGDTAVAEAACLAAKNFAPVAVACLDDERSIDAVVDVLTKNNPATQDTNDGTFRTRAGMLVSLGTVSEAVAERCRARCEAANVAYVQAALVTGEADTGESHFGVTTSAYVASDAGEDAVAAAEAIVFVPLCGGRGRIKRVALAEDAIGARAAQLEDMSRLIADQSMELDGVIELHERLEAKTEECESLAEKLAELEARMGIQSEELDAVRAEDKSTNDKSDELAELRENLATQTALSRTQCEEITVLKRQLEDLTHRTSRDAETGAEERAVLVKREAAARARLEEDLRLDFDSRVSVKDDTISDLHEEVRLAKEECGTLRRRAEDAAIKLRSSESQLAATTLAKSSLEVSFAETTSYLNDTRKALETLQMEMEDKIAAHRTRAREAAASEAAARAALEAETERASKETSEANKRCEEAERIAERETKLAKDATHRAEHVDASIADATHELELKIAELEAQCEVRIRSAGEQLTRASDEIERLAGVAADSDAAQLDARAETERLRLALASATAEHARLRETNGTFDGLIAGLKAEVLAAEKKAEEAEFAANEKDAEAHSKITEVTDTLVSVQSREAATLAELATTRGALDAARVKATEAVARATRDVGPIGELLAVDAKAFKETLEAVKAGAKSANEAVREVCDALERALDGGYGRARVCVAERLDPDVGKYPVLTVAADGEEASRFVTRGKRLEPGSLAHHCITASGAGTFNSATHNPPSSDVDSSLNSSIDEVRVMRGVTALRGSGRADAAEFEDSLPVTRPTGSQDTRTDTRVGSIFSAAPGAGVAVTIPSALSHPTRVLCADTRDRDSPLSAGEVVTVHEAAELIASVYAADAARVKRWTRAVIRDRWSELDAGSKENDPRSTHFFDNPVAAARVLHERTRHKQTLETLLKSHNLLGALAAMGRPDGTSSLPPTLATPAVLSAWAVCACVGTVDAQPPPFTRVDAKAFTDASEAASAVDTVLTRRRKDTSASDALGIDLRLPPVGKSGDVRKMETRLRSTGDLAAIRASRLWTELLPCVDGLINDADADPMAAIKVRAGLTADRKLGDATRALLAAAPMLRASLDGDGEWAELGGFAPSPDADLVSACGVLWAWAGTCVCAWRAWVRIREMRIDESAVLSILDNMERDANMEAGV